MVLPQIFDGRLLEPSLPTNSHPLLKIRFADIIDAVPVHYGESVRVFGRQTGIEAMLGGGAAAIRMLLVGVDPSTDQFDQLLNLVAQVKGSHEYLPPAPSSNPPPPVCDQKTRKHFKRRVKALKRILSELDALRASDPTGPGWLLSILIGRIE